MIGGKRENENSNLNTFFLKMNFRTLVNNTPSLKLVFEAEEVAVQALFLSHDPRTTCLHSSEVFYCSDRISRSVKNSSPQFSIKE